MSSKENACRKFQANIFNKSKCQNCFKARESHSSNDEDLNQAKPIYGGWLSSAPEGTNFDNPSHRSRKWQRRFFVSYEHGSLRYALDEMPSTSPQGTINMNQCSDVVDGESRTGQKSSSCILTPEREHFIRAECKEIINGWQEASTVYPRTNKQNQKKKRKVDPPTQQDGVTPSQGFASEDMNGHSEPGPAKVTVTSSSSGGGVPCLPSSMADAEQIPTSRATSWQEQSRWSRATVPCSHSASCLSQSNQSQPDAGAGTRDDGSTVSSGRKVRVESGYFSSEKTKSEPSPHPTQPPQHSPSSSSASSSSLGAPSSRRSQIIGRFEENQSVERMDTSGGHDASANQRQGRSERRHSDGKHEMSSDTGKDCSAPNVSTSNFLNLRRAKSLDRRASESSLTPDLLNFKKGWMTKLYEDGVWKKHWFVSTDQSSRYYKDSIAEEASESDGEIDLSTCYDVKEFPVQRNYGFQILCTDGACTSSAMTSGIRRNWIQAIMKNVRPTIAPDVTRSMPDESTKAHVKLEPCLPVAADPKPDDHNPPAGSDAAAPPSEPRRKGVRERRREGRSKTFDWTEFKAERKETPAKDRADTVDLSSTFSTTSSCSPSSSASSSASSPVSSSSLQTSSVSGPPPPNVKEEPSAPWSRRQETMDHSGGIGARDATDGVTPDVREEIEQRWHQVETTPLREEKRVPISTAVGNGERSPAHELAASSDKELGQKRKESDRLQEQNNSLKEQSEDASDREQSAREGYVSQATCERGFAAMEETHQKSIEDLQRQHQREISKLMEERERSSAEETAATIAAIEAMKNAHKEESEKNQRSQSSGSNSDIDELRSEYEEELQSIQRESEVSSEQYSQKCSENAHSAQASEAERQALRQCQRENQELNAHNQELNNRSTAEITRMRSCFSGETALSPLTHGKDVYESEVSSRIKESEIQYSKQEIHSLKDESQSASRDKKYATDKYKDIYTESSIVKAKADCDIGKSKEKSLMATEALGERSVDDSVTSGYDIMKSKSNPDFMKKEKSAASKPSRGLRSKSSKEGSTVQERMKLFEAKDSRKI